MPGEFLHGGRTTVGVVRIGETVRRPATPNSPFVRSLLLHLERSEFTAVPRHLGTDEDGRDIFSYVPGDVPAELGEHSDRALESAARLIRRFHDATVPLTQSEASRQSGVEVVCHNDLSPCNFVFRAGNPVALIDFDDSRPGMRSFDLGYAVWLWLDWGNTEWSAADQLRRLRLFLAAYGPGPSESEVVEMAIRRQAMVIEAGRQAGDQSRVDWAVDCRRWTIGHLS